MTIVVVRRQKRITMEGSASSINSRATAIKTILLAAWRGKLSNEEWENRIRKVLPRGVNGDVYDLADCLLRQALVGPVPNQLFISYLKHAVNCELVSHGAVLSSIAHQSINIRTTASNLVPNRTSSIICLLEFLKTFRDQISCQGTEVECLNLCHSVSQLIHWLLKCVQHSLETILGATTTLNPSNNNNNNNNNNNSGGGGSSSNNSSSSSGGSNNNNNIANSANYNPLGPNNVAQHELTVGIIDLCTETLHYFIDRPYTKSLLFISKIEYVNEFEEILEKVQTIQQKLTSCPSLQFIHDRVPNLKVLQQLNITFNSRDMHPSAVAAQQLRCLQTHRIRSTHVTSGSSIERKIQQSLLTNDSTMNYALFNSLYSLIAFDAILRPARSHKLLARQIATMTYFHSAPLHMTYCELIRVCMIGLIDADGSPAKVKWAFFTFLKMPKLLIELKKVFKAASMTAGDSTTTTTSQVDSFTSNQINNFINDLRLAFERLCEFSPLLDEAEYKCNCDFFKCLVKELIKNEPVLSPLKNLENYRKRQQNTYNNDGPVGACMILKTEPFVTSLLQTFDSEQDPVELFAIISQLVSGKHFEFTLNAAASTGRLQMFVKKLVEHNEINRVPRNDSPKNPQIQALIFDITFLILTYIAQQYGSEVIGPDQQTTFNKWYHESYNPATRINCPKEMLKNSNGEVVSRLIKQIVRPDEGIQMKSVNWREVCFNLPSTINEILVAWNQGHLDDNCINGIIERIRSKMCFLAIVTASWLQCHIKTLSEAEKAKPMLFLQGLTKPSPQARQQRQAMADSGLKSESYSERSSLMCSITRKIYFELAPKTSSSSSLNQNSSNNNNNSTVSYNSTSADIDESLDESTYHSINDKFLSTLTTQEIFLANVKQCLSRGWIDHKSLNSLNSLFKMIGSECFTNLIVEQILTSHESPSDLSRAVNITFGLFHLDIEACAFALLRDTIPSWLMGEKKQVLLNQPRAFALAHLTVMTIIEVFSNLKAANKTSSSNQADDKKLPAVNGIKQEPGIQKPTSMDVDPSGNVNGGREVKRIKLTHGSSEKTDLSQDTSDRIEKLNDCIADLMRLFKEIMSDSVMSQRTLFPVLFLQQTVVCTREGSSVITVHLRPEILLDIINLFSSELTFELVLAISNLSTTNSRKYAAKAMCQLAQVKECKQNQLINSHALNSASRSSFVSNQTGNNASGSKAPLATQTPMVIG